MISRSFIKGLCLALTGAALCLPAAAQTSQRPTDMSTDEAGMWYQVDKIEAQVKTSGLRVTDPQLVQYVQDVTCKVTGPDCNQIRPYIINAGVFNASMYPNGMMLVNSGLLLRAENEAQLACVIGHEYGHFKELHSLERWRKAKNMANLSLVFSLAAGAAGAGSEAGYGAQLLTGLLQQSFSREHEREADDIGFRTASSAGYDSSQCADVWKNLIAEQQASSFKKVRNRGKRANPFSSHPVPKERAQTLGQLAKAFPGGKYDGEAEHKAATAKFYSSWLETELLAKDYDRHIHLYSELKSRGRPAGPSDYYIGEAYRKRKDEGDRARAAEAFKAAAQGQNPPALVWRALGEHYRRNKQKPEALEAYRKYLAAAPAAPDRELITAYIDRLTP